MQTIFNLLISYNSYLYNSLNRVSKTVKLDKQILGRLVVNKNGKIHTYNKGKLHSFDDEAAVIQYGISIWYNKGKPYRKKFPYKITELKNITNYFWNRNGFFPVKATFYNNILKCLYFKNYIIKSILFLDNNKTLVKTEDIHILNGNEKSWRKELEGEPKKRNIIKILKNMSKNPEDYFQVSIKYRFNISLI